MKRDNTLMKFTTFVLLITIVAIALVSGTYAKYTSTATATGTAKVAKWSIELNGDEITTMGDDETVSFDLFDTLKEDDVSTNEDNVADGVIAPGTGGAFALEVENLSEVDAEYTIDFQVTNASSVPVEFSTDNGATWKAWNEIVDITTTAVDMEETSTVNVQWRWDFDANDDTALGIAAQTAAPEVTVTATITVDQVD